MFLKRTGLEQLLRVYEDVEQLLRSLKQREALSVGSSAIDIRKLIEQLSRSKKRLERKIGNTLLLEKHNLKRKLKLIASDIRSKR